MAACLLSATALAAGVDDRLVPARAEVSPVIDGVLDDAVWQDAPFVNGFETYTPDFGRPMAEPTDVYYAYDRENLYFAFRCHDSQPHLIKTSVTARDRIRADDWIAINLDSFNDQQSLYAFYVNPMGIQADTRYAAGREDAGFDTVWYSAGVVDDGGYTIEVQIPLKSLRFRNTDLVTMGVIFERHISRHTQAGTYPPLDPAKGGDFQTEMQPIVYEDVEQYRLLELLPAVTRQQRNELDEGQLAGAGADNDIGLTVKYGVTSDLVVDATFNPDFSQVESDAGQIDVNLRSPVFYPEKRPFFLEGHEHFNFAGPVQHDPLREVIHTRNIVEPSAGLKLSGKIGQENTIAAIFARDRSPVGDDSGESADFAIFRFKRALRENSYVGAVYAGRERAEGYNRVFGADGLFRMSASSTIGYHAFLSRTVVAEGTPRQDGHAVGAGYSFNTRDLTLDFVALDIAEDFRTETGFLTREGVFRARGYAMPKFYPSESFIQRVDTFVLSEHTHDKPSDLWESYNEASLRLVLPRTSSAAVEYNYSTEIFLGQEFDTNGVRLIGSSQLTRRLFFQLQAGRRQAIFYSADPYQGRSRDAAAAIRYQASDQVEGTLTYTFSSFVREADHAPVYDIGITRGKLNYQLNKYLLFRGIVEHNSFYDRLTTDFLASFTYIPGTVVHLGYGSLYEKVAWRGGRYVPADRFIETERGIFFKASYLWRR